jgi:hypothetical protein
MHTVAIFDAQQVKIQRDGRTVLHGIRSDTTRLWNLQLPDMEQPAPDPRPTSPCIHNLAATETDPLPSPVVPSEEPSPAATAYKAHCTHFRRGQCRYGPNCRFTHATVAPPPEVCFTATFANKHYANAVLTTASTAGINQVPPRPPWVPPKSPPYAPLSMPDTSQRFPVSPPPNSARMSPNLSPCTEGTSTNNARVSTRPRPSQVPRRKPKPN